jgi:hypothetical protein
MARSACFTDYYNCIGDPDDILNNLNCAADLLGCLREVVLGADLSALDETPPQPEGGGGRHETEGNFGGGGTLERPPVDMGGGGGIRSGGAGGGEMMRMPSDAALARLPADTADAVRDSVNLINALRSLAG